MQCLQVLPTPLCAAIRLPHSLTPARAQSRSKLADYIVLYIGAGEVTSARAADRYSLNEIRLCNGLSRLPDCLLSIYLLRQSVYLSVRRVCVSLIDSSPMRIDAQQRILLAG